MEGRVEPQKSEWDEVKENIAHNVVNPLVGGLAFGFAWLGVFHLLKKKFIP